MGLAAPSQVTSAEHTQEETQERDPHGVPVEGTGYHAEDRQVV